MARNIAESRLGRALMAGIPVALMMVGGEAINGSWSFERRDHALLVSWSSASEKAAGAADKSMHVTACLGSGCNHHVSVTMPRPAIATQMIGIVQTIRTLMPIGSGEQRGERSNLIKA